MENNTNQLNSMLCKRNCGFFGNSSCEGYCSKCYKDHVKRQNSGSAAGRVTPTTGISTTSSASASIASVTSQSQQLSETLMNPVTNALLDEIKMAAQEQQQDQQQEQKEFSKEATTNFTPTSSTSNNNNSVSITNNTNNNNASTNTKTNTTTTATTIPIPIPSVKSNQNESSSTATTTSSTTTTSAAETTVVNDAMGMSVPADLLLGSSIVSTASSPDTSVCDIANSSLGSNLNANGGEKKKRTRCVVPTCRRKVGLTGFDCRCGGLYCWEHRYSDKHDCQFDYKELGQDQIRKNNPIVVGEKIQKI